MKPQRGQTSGTAEVGRPRRAIFARPTKLKLAVTARVGRSHAPYLRRRLRQAHAVLHTLRQPPLQELSVAIVNDATMSVLHDRYLGLNSPTDVLTFELDHDRRGRVLSGEIVICLNEAARQAKARGHAVKDELLLYALHGMLHLCAFDDRSDRDFAAMHRMEDHILNAIGVGAVFAGRPGRRRQSTAAGGKR